MATSWARFASSSRIFDVIVIAVMLGTLAAAATTDEPYEPTPAAVTLALVGCAAIGARERFPILVVALALAAYAATGVPVLAMLAVGSLAEQYGNVLSSAMTAVAGLGVVLWLDPRPTSMEPLLMWGAVIVLPIAVGLNLATRRAALAAAVSRADRLEAAQSELQEQARREERARIAREMHDVVAHQVSLIALHAGGLELSAQGTPQAETAALIRQTARRALEELRSVVGVLRSDPEETWAHRPGVAAIGDMVARWQVAGMDVTLDDRTPGGFAARVRGPAGRTVYRVVEESLTNASKHAAGATVVVTLRPEGERLEVTVHSTAATRTSSRADTGAGTGLVGLAERARLLGGSLDAHDDGAGGFLVRLSLPLPEPEPDE